MTTQTETINNYLAGLPIWQKNNLEGFRKLIHKAFPDVTEDWKWNVPVFVIKGKVTFAMSAFKAHTKYNFILNGALLKDSDKLFNNGFESKKSRGIDLKETENIDTQKLLELVIEAIKLMN